MCSWSNFNLSWKQRVTGGHLGIFKEIEPEAEVAAVRVKARRMAVEVTLLTGVRFLYPNQQTRKPMSKKWRDWEWREIKSEGVSELKGTCQTPMPHQLNKWKCRFGVYLEIFLDDDKFLIIVSCLWTPSWFRSEHVGKAEGLK